jgi:hypothetical protein
MHGVGRVQHYDDVGDDNGDDEDTATMMTAMVCNSNTRIRYVFPYLDYYISKAWMSCQFLIKQNAQRNYPDC